ncbi:Helicase associated domain protein [Streptomyces sp. NRRL B-24484]|uniref:Helicase associated domain protein n=1 Tax=Streptomyces sp. NRRL B-24484 TaxID=1463833 RepID=UPI0004BF69BE|nr:Helicase associated domain protein [Streptomyces sp. NRRL B-24484]
MPAAPSRTVHRVLQITASRCLVLVSAELLANAADHGGGPTALCLRFDPGTGLLRIAVTNTSPAGEPGALAPERRAALEEIDPWWCPAWPIVWQRAYSVARMWWLESDGRVDWAASPEETVFEGEQLGRWVVAQRAGWPGLEADQQDLLAAIGIEEDPGLVAAKAAAEAKPKVSRADHFAQGLAALARFVEREGHVRVPRPHKEPLEVAVAGPGGEESVEVVHVGLGAWLNNQKARRAKLTPGQLAQLAEHGVEWSGHERPQRGPGGGALRGRRLPRRTPSPRAVERHPAACRAAWPLHRQGHAPVRLAAGVPAVRSRRAHRRRVRRRLPRPATRLVDPASRPGLPVGDTLLQP